MEVDLDQPAVVCAQKPGIEDIKVHAGRIVHGRGQCQALDFDPDIAGGVAIVGQSSDVIEDRATPVDDLDIEIVASNEEHVMGGIVSDRLGTAYRLPLDRVFEVNGREDLRASGVGFDNLGRSEVSAIDDEDVTIVWVHRHIFRVVAAQRFGRKLPKLLGGIGRIDPLDF